MKSKLAENKMTTWQHIISVISCSGNGGGSTNDNKLYRSVSSSIVAYGGMAAYGGGKWRHGSESISGVWQRSNGERGVSAKTVTNSVSKRHSEDAASSRTRAARRSLID